MEKKKADTKNGKHPVKDLRSALELLKTIPGQYAETDVEVDPRAELSGVYRHIGAGGTVMRPTKEGPAMVFHKIKDIRMQELPLVSWLPGHGWPRFLTVSPESGETALGMCIQPHTARADRRGRSLPGGGAPV